MKTGKPIKNWVRENVLFSQQNRIREQRTTIRSSVNEKVMVEVRGLVWQQFGFSILKTVRLAHSETISENHGLLQKPELR